MRTYVVNLALLLQTLSFLHESYKITCKKLSRFVIYCKILQDFCKNNTLPCKILKDSCKISFFCVILGCLYWEPVLYIEGLIESFCVRFKPEPFHWSFVCFPTFVAFEIGNGCNVLFTDRKCTNTKEQRFSEIERDEWYVITNILHQFWQIYSYFAGGRISNTNMDSYVRTVLESPDKQIFPLHKNNQWSGSQPLFPSPVLPPPPPPDEKVMSKEEKAIIKRKNIVNEIYHTEMNYVDFLRRLKVCQYLTALHAFPVKRHVERSKMLHF